MSPYELPSAPQPSLGAFMGRLVRTSAFYRRKLALAGIDAAQIRTAADLACVPFTDKDELRDEYPLGMLAVPQDAVVRVHASSGTTGRPIIVPYTAGDVEAWTQMFARCYLMAGVTERDRVQITPGYGLWTAGIGFQAAAERVGAMAVPTGPGNTERQLQMMTDLQTSVLCATSSYALLLSEEVTCRGLRRRIGLRTGIFGSERWGEKMRRRIESDLGLESYDLYGLTEVYGPGIAVDCPRHDGLHYWSDYLLFEIVDPQTGVPLEPGEQGELVITTIRKEGMPLLRYRTHDITRILPGRCACGSPFPRIDRILGRSDDMIKLKGVKVYPAQFDHLLRVTDGAGSEFQLHVGREHGRDTVLLRFEHEPGCDPQTVRARVMEGARTLVGIRLDAEAVPPRTLPRSEKKSKRFFDNRNQPDESYVPDCPGE